jgi:hypothetical protein
MKYEYETYNNIIFRYEYQTSNGEMLIGTNWEYRPTVLEVWHDGDGTPLTEQEALELALKKGLTKEQFYGEK